MARTVRSPKLDTRSARAKLPARREPYWVLLTAGLHLGYRRAGAHGGSWIARAYDPATRKRAYRALGPADDAVDADDERVLAFAQAQARARAWFPRAFLPDAEGDGHGARRPRTVGDLLHGYLAWLADHRKPSTARATRSAAQAHILPALGELRLEALTAAHLKRWHEALATTPARLRTKRGAAQLRVREATDEDAKRARRSTANRVLTILKAALNRAQQDGLLPSDEAWRKVKPFGRAEAARVRWLTKEECGRLLNACPPGFRRLARGALLTGCRYGELCRVEVGDLDADAGTLHVRDSKSGRPRHVPLDDEAAGFLRGLAAGRQRHERLFVRTDGRPWGMSHQLRPIAAASAAARLEPAATFHSLRHTWASHRVMAGAPLMVVARVLGHADTRMVEKHYGHLAPSYVRDVVRATSLRLGAGDEPGAVVAIRGGSR
jgi:integrase